VLQALDRLQVEAAGRRHHVLLQHRAAEVVGAVVQRDLGELGALGDVARLDVVEVVEDDPAQGLDAQVDRGGGLLRVEVLLRDAVGLRVPRGEGREAAGPVLQVPQSDQVLDALRGRLDVAEHHGARRPEACLVHALVHLQPAIRRGLLGGDDLAHALDQHLGARAGDAAEPRSDEVLQDLLDRPLLHVAEVIQLGSGEGVAVDVEASPDVGDQLAPPVREQVGVVPSLHQQLLAAQPHGLLDLAVDLVPREDVRLAVAGPTVERAEPAVRDADVGGVQVAVDDVGDASLGVQAALHRVRHAAEGEEVGLLVEEQRLLLGDALTREDTVLEGRQFRRGAAAAARGERGDPLLGPAGSCGGDHRPGS